MTWAQRSHSRGLQPATLMIIRYTICIVSCANRNCSPSAGVAENQLATSDACSRASLLLVATSNGLTHCCCLQTACDRLLNQGYVTPELQHCSFQSEQTPICDHRSDDRLTEPAAHLPRAADVTTAVRLTDVAGLLTQPLWICCRGARDILSLV